MRSPAACAEPGLRPHTDGKDDEIRRQPRPTLRDDNQRGSFSLLDAR